jgi:hypothetical protein
MPRRHSKRHTRRHKKRSNLKMMGGECPGSASAYVSEITSTNGEQVTTGSLNGTSNNALVYTAYKGGDGEEMRRVEGEEAKMLMPQTEGGADPEMINLLKTQQGGRRYKQKRGGSGILTDLAVPAVLLVANQAMKRRNSTFKKRRSIRRR